MHDGVAQVEIPNDPNYHPEHRHGESGRRVAEVPEGDDAGQTALHLLRARRRACAAPCAAGLDRQVEGQVRRRLGQVMREETLARQIKWASCPRHQTRPQARGAIKDWDKLSADEKKLFARQAEVFAAFLEHTDHEIGRVIQAIDETGPARQHADLLHRYGDNGTSAEGGMNGMFNEMTYFNGVQEKVEDMVKLVDKWGGPETYPHMAAGWAVAFDTPFQWTKQVASDFGGTKVGMVAHWPKGIKAKTKSAPSSAM
jgi:arylsulfatase A-like enzyme